MIIPMSETERASFWEKRARENDNKAKFYQEKLLDAHALLGRILQQFSERWDIVTLSEFIYKEKL
jgi:hypothetical protein